MMRLACRSQSGAAEGLRAVRNGGLSLASARNVPPHFPPGRVSLGRRQCACPRLRTDSARQLLVKYMWKEETYSSSSAHYTSPPRGSEPTLS
ncbi:hypothetical protein RR46_06083 [Papilio xuthus]|uniref:Uncharacterized protein n=1 Tax=Papilio xuthus TaxID=66420 RepID=A0A194Q8C4_PAPXU|nr:hypothetical protein RR46_06083 [Papilio xuthus]